jgi:hypothetical protein
MSIIGRSACLFHPHEQACGAGNVWNIFPKILKIDLLQLFVEPLETMRLAELNG